MAVYSPTPHKGNFLHWLLASMLFTGVLYVTVQLNTFTKWFSHIEPFVSPDAGWNPDPVAGINGRRNHSSTSIGGGEGIAACLLIMDDNHFLIEWLAYHFYYLPLRRLIVAVDPKSKTSPKSILDRYQSRGLINITIWNDDDFFPFDELQKLETNQLQVYLARQQYFILQCTKQLKQEQWTWTTHIDTDEFVLPNRDAHPAYHVVDTNRTVYSILTQSPQKEYWENRTVPSSCHPMIRLDMGIKVSSDEEANQRVPNGLFNGSHFLTFRFRWPQYTGKGSMLPPGKAFLDLSRVPSTDLRMGNTNPHRIIKNHCKLFIDSRHSPFLVYHYAGTFEQFSYRVDGRNSRSRDEYNLRYFDEHSSRADDGATFWLGRFVEEMGIELASLLLDGVGELESEPMIMSKKISK